MKSHNKSNYSGLVMKMNVQFFSALLLCAGLFATEFVHAQNNSGVYVDPNRSERQFRTTLNISGNDVESIITNYGTIGRGNESINQAGVWPRGTGHGHLHEMTGFIGAEVNLNRGGVIGPKQVMISDGYRDGGETIDPVTGIEWKFQPLPGYLNLQATNVQIANSQNPNSWPTSWPGRDATWSGAWNGFFGLNQFNADQEVFYVMDDAWNREYQFYPDNRDSTKRGLGVQVNVRLFQWSQALAKDILFMQYEVTNTGTTNFTYNMNDNPIFFGGYTDVNPSGAGATDDAAAFDRGQNIVYGWSATGVGLWTQFREIPPGYIGWKFLESPGIADDGIDNDGDGVIDERRDNPAGEYVFGPCGFYDEPQFRWEGDENCNWNPLTDDVGSDGIGPLDPNYPGPDADGTEGNGRPDQGEPNFGRLDKNESDQIGLTSFFAPLFGTVNINNEEQMWPRMQPGFFDIPQQAVNQYWIFASGPFTLRPDQTERFSTSFVFGANEREMFRNAQVAQRIYDADYRFARPPLPARLTAIPGDGRVVLQWDETSEFSFDPIYGFDFEGYRIIKATDPSFRDARDITDALGTPRYKVSIAQYDLVNGLFGPHPLQLGEEIEQPTGIHYYMGDDTGLRHYYIDEDVINGRVYYYAVISYDQGYDLDFYQRGISAIDNLFRISPSESPASITVTNGEITSFSPNTAMARPNTQPTDLIEGSLDTDNQQRIAQTGGVATGTVRAIPVSPQLFEDVSFNVSFDQVRREGKSSVEFTTNTYTVTDDLGNRIIDQAEVPRRLSGDFQRMWTHELLDLGFVLQFENQEPTLANTQQNSGWQQGSQTNIRANISTVPSFTYPNGPIWPLSLVIEVFDPAGEPVDSYFTSTTGRISRPAYFKVYELGTERKLDYILNEPASTRDNGVIDLNENIQLVFKDNPTDTRFLPAWQISFLPPVDAAGNELPAEQVVLPQPGDRFVMRSQIPFGERDTYFFRSRARVPNPQADKSLLDLITVVPNPYVAATITEGRPFLQGRGERRIEFRNLPTNATLRIYTASGTFVRQLDESSGFAVWDLRTKDNLEAAFGLYFYHVTVEGIGEKVGKFAIIN
jgi:hypothetical protein